MFISKIKHLTNLLFDFSSNEGANHDRVDAAVKALMKLYNKNNGLWNTAGWWNSANCLTALIDYMLATGSKEYVWAVENTFQNARKQVRFKFIQYILSLIND